MSDKATEPKYQMNSGEDCFICGDEFIIHTDVPQDEKDANDEYIYLAQDGDLAKCPGCGAVGYVSADEQGAGISWDDSSELNLTACIDWQQKEIDQLRADNARLKSLCADAAAMLRELEWPGGWRCKFCRGLAEMHAPDCPLAALVKRLGGQGR